MEIGKTQLDGIYTQLLLCVGVCVVGMTRWLLDNHRRFYNLIVMHRGHTYTYDAWCVNNACCSFIKNILINWDYKLYRITVAAFISNIVLTYTLTSCVSVAEYRETSLHFNCFSENTEFTDIRRVMRGKESGMQQSFSLNEREKKCKVKNCTKCEKMANGKWNDQIHYFLFKSNTFHLVLISFFNLSFYPGARKKTQSLK